MNLDKISRIEIIGPGGRLFVGYFEVGVETSIQDEGRTLKVFVGEEVTPPLGGGFWPR